MSAGSLGVTPTAPTRGDLPADCARAARGATTRPPATLARKARRGISLRVYAIPRSLACLTVGGGEDEDRGQEDSHDDPSAGRGRRARAEPGARPGGGEVGDLHVRRARSPPAGDPAPRRRPPLHDGARPAPAEDAGQADPLRFLPAALRALGAPRSEERRVGKECRCRWSPGPSKETQNQHDAVQTM